MDGAMKFVKGDAFAGILITLINILGGLYSGVIVKGMNLTQALHQYSLLTVGDGLVNQIPALLISITAGIIITRVTDEESKNSLGKDIGIQIFSQPKALLMAAGLALFLSLVPGFPMALFLTLAAGLAGVGFFLLLHLQRRVQKPATVAEFVVDAQREMVEHVGQAIPLILEAGPRLFEEFHRDPRWRHCFGELYSRLKIHLTQQMGVHFPELRLRLNEQIPETFRYQIRIWDVPVDYGYIDPEFCCRISGKIPAPSAETPPVKEGNTIHGTPIQLYHIHQKKNLEQRGIHTLGPEEMLLRHIARILKKHAGDFIGIQEVHHLLAIVEMKFPDLVREIIPKMMTVQKLTEIVKRLVEEEVPIKDFRLILQTLSGIQPEEKDPVTLTEQVRIGLRRTLSYLYSEAGQRLHVVTIEPEIETTIRQGIQKNGQECFLVLPPRQLEELAFSFKHCLLRMNPRPARTVILTQMELRRYVRKIIENDLPNQAVLSYQELDPKLVLNPLGTIHYPLDAETVVVAQ
jgi:type III secretion protein V